MKGLIWILILLISLSAQADKKILYWVAPMDPNYRRDKPGKSPMGMDLIPVYEDESDSKSDVSIAPQVVQNLGVRTDQVKRRDLARIIDTVGYIDFDESKLSHIHLRVSGWVEKISVNSEGDRVKKGQRLFNLYSPELVNAQEELIHALNSGNRSLIRASQERLLALGISPSQIKTLKKNKRVLLSVPIYAPQSGVVADLNAREGMYLKPSDNAMSLADLSSVWLIAEIFERQAEWVKLSDQAEIKLPYLPGRTWRGQVQYIYPSLDAKTRTLKARLKFANPAEVLKPNMYAQVKIYASPKKQVLSIPIEALIRTGDKDRVIVQVAPGQFNAREVEAGIESGDFVEILSGLKVGETVVTSGQFLIDSEASLKASLKRMNAPNTEQKAASVSGRGQITGIDVQQHLLKLNHEPIPALGWPGMEMIFSVDPSVDLSSLHLGDSIEFELMQQGDQYVITAVQKHSGGQP